MLHASVVPLLTFLVGCAGSGGPAAGKSTGAMTAQEATTMAAEVSKTVEELRGLKFKRPVPVKVVDDATARVHFKARAEKYWPEARVKIDQKVYAQLGLLPPGTDILKTLLDMLEEQAGGYYDPDSDTFYVLGDMPRSMAPLIMAHELTHALDDQHFDIDGLLGKVENDDDRQTALGSVVEGSGTLVMSVYSLREIGAGRMTLDSLMEFQQTEAGRAEKLKNAPVLLQRSLVAPYVLGQSFLLRGQLMGMMAGVKGEDLDRAFRDPPASCEQILHPEKYWDADDRDAPKPVPLRDLSAALGRGWTLAARGTIGELVLAILVGADRLNLQGMELAMASAWTNAAASGWGGDLYHHYVNGDQAVTVLATVWDSPADAQEFETGLRPVEERRSWRRGPAVVLVAGAGEQGEALGQAALQSLAAGNR
jgi:hypothetical protein